ncbi:hypothetical protein BS78_07G086900 [Paspalum vaginatum]|nr:hypothetical protein BS78_07G086900 [Paspalum vaginatum]KAJ1267813.1 hypothetical protein BS78_07G086900 [Paspalum vaginatum]
MSGPRACRSSSPQPTALLLANCKQTACCLPLFSLDLSPPIRCQVLHDLTPASGRVDQDQVASVWECL